MDSWKRFDETLIPDKVDFYSNLNMEDITDIEYKYLKKKWKNFGIKNLGEYHDSYVQSGTLLLADVFGNFRNKFIEIYELDPAHFLSAPELAWQACLKKTEIKLGLQKVEKGIRGGICHAIHRYGDANNKYMKKCNKDKYSSYLMFIDANNLYRWAMSQKLPVNSFKWKKTCQNSMKNLKKILTKVVI